MAGGTDEILDFNRSECDVIDLSAIDAIKGGDDDSLAFIGDETFTGTADELRYYTNWEDKMFISGDTDGDGAANPLIEIDGDDDLTGADFML